MSAIYPPELIEKVAAAIGGVVVQDLEAELTTEEARRVEAVAVLDALVDATGGVDHVVRSYGATFTLQHPITERLDGSLFDCGLHHHLADAAPIVVGTYRVTKNLAIGWAFARIEELTNA